MFKQQEANLEINITDTKGNNKKDILGTGDNLEIKTSTSSKTFTIVIKGDTNGDGKITSVDMLRVQKHLLKYSTLKDAQKEACDTNYDDKISSVDMLRVQKHLLKYITLK